MSSVDRNHVKKVEGETLETFQEEIPSIYYSDKTPEDFAKYKRNAEYTYRAHFKFPPKMFEGANVIDFGAGTGEDIVYLTNWGATLTLVEMNKLAQDISRDVFRKYATDPDRHRFVHSSIFDYDPSPMEQYDIVHCSGVLSTTAAKEEAFRKIATFLRPGGYLIYGDPNKSGGFQNMLERFAVYHFAKTKDDMVEVSETLFKEDIDRAHRFVPRTRRAIIFDRWVIQSEDDASVAEVVRWMHDSGLEFYSSYPAVLMPLMGDSSYHQPKFDPTRAESLFAIPELVWMMQTEPDSVNMEAIDRGADQLARRLSDLSAYVANFNSSSTIDVKTFEELTGNLQSAAQSFQLLDPVRSKLTPFLREANEFVRLVLTSDIEAVRAFILSTKVLFKGACGVRQVDFIAYKPV
jgi:SAM-dependent methyltransferase